MNRIQDFSQARQAAQPIVVVTAYDVLLARLAAEAGVDAILVGDSVAMVVHGHPSTIHATTEMMCLHTAAVRRGAPESVIIADLPFLTARRGARAAVDAAGELLRAGATGVKLEGVAGHAEVVAHLVGSGIPVMGHIGLTPQSHLQLGGYRVQGRSPEEAARLQREALILQDNGAFALVIECVPAAVAREITAALSIPTIGIGAGVSTSGQVLVLTDLLGLDAKFQPRFARRYLDGASNVRDALKAFASDVRAGLFPSPAESPN